MKMSPSRLIALNAIVATLYAVPTMLLGGISFSPLLQIRPAECLAILPCVLPTSYIGLAIGCAIANIISPFGLVDIIFGSLITLTAGLITSKIKNPYLAPLPPILLNAFLLPLIWYFAAGDLAYWYNVLGNLISQSIVIYALGLPLYFTCKKIVLPQLLKN